jgi:hypothetical protein
VSVLPGGRAYKSGSRLYRVRRYRTGGGVQYGNAAMPGVARAARRLGFTHGPGYNGYGTFTDDGSANCRSFWIGAVHAYSNGGVRWGCCGLGVSVAVIILPSPEESLATIAFKLV